MARFLKEIFDRAPETMYRENALAWILYSRILVALEQFDKAEDFLTKLINVLEAEQMTPFHYRVLSGCYLNLGIITMITSLYTRNYDYVRLFEKGCQYCRLSGHTFTGPAAVFNLAPYQCRVTVPDRGEIEKSLAAIAGMARYFSEAVGGCGYGIDDLGWGELAFFRADPFKAEQDFHLALAKARERYQYEIENSALI
jgi:LuxR family maltose regulon positive regulatory protein